MRTLLQYINEYLEKISSIDEYLSTKNIDKDPDEIRNSKIKKEADNPDTWEVGDIICGTAGATMYLPRWFKIIKRTNKQFTCIRLKGKIVSGHRNGQWEEVPTDEEYDNKEYKGRINKWGRLKIDDTSMYLWDGKTPLYGDDMD